MPMLSGRRSVSLSLSLSIYIHIYTHACVCVYVVFGAGRLGISYASVGYRNVHNRGEYNILVFYMVGQEIGNAWDSNTSAECHPRQICKQVPECVDNLAGGHSFTDIIEFRGLIRSLF